MAKASKKVTTVFKIVISTVLIYFILTKINVQEIKEILLESDFLYFFLAAFFFVVSKLISALRLNLYFHVLHIPLKQKSNLALYILGMFYNLFLPGGIGGDAYKGYLLKKTFQVATKKIVSVLVLDRLGGLLLLFTYACALLSVLEFASFDGYRVLFLLAIPLAVFVFWLLNYKFFAYVMPVFWKSIFLSAIVQLAQLICIFLVLKALHIDDNQMAYLVIFLVSSIVATVPLTIGGIGSREVTFFYGATLLGLDQNISVGVSILFFLITAVVSLTGIWYHFKKVTLKLQETSRVV